jgi:hypothetical protein
MRALATILIGLFLLPPSGRAAETDGLLNLNGRTFLFERIGTLTSLRCAESDKSEDCLRLEEMALQPQVNWERLLDKSRRKAAVGKKDARISRGPLASETLVDQHGGPWVFSVWADSTTVVPDFPGYRLQLSNEKIASAEVLRNRKEWEEASRELGLNPETGKKEKRGLGGWLK